MMTTAYQAAQEAMNKQHTLSKTVFTRCTRRGWQACSSRDGLQLFLADACTSLRASRLGEVHPT